MPSKVGIVRNGEGTTASPYTWTISGLPLDTVVTFTESGYQIAGYVVTTTLDSTTGQAKAAIEPGTVTITNEYSPAWNCPPGTVLYTAAGKNNKTSHSSFSLSFLQASSVDMHSRERNSPTFDTSDPMGSRERPDRGLDICHFTQLLQKKHTTKYTMGSCKTGKDKAAYCILHIAFLKGVAKISCQYWHFPV